MRIEKIDLFHDADDPEIRIEAEANQNESPAGPKIDDTAISNSRGATPLLMGRCKFQW